MQASTLEGQVLPTPTAPRAPQHHLLECDYDTNPTVLYRAIEAKQWEYAVSLCLQNKCEEEAATWVVRKETNGKLRWRLLPLHAAIIFGSPLKLVECLLADFPAAAQCKDDQGLLPLHLAFRNEGAASWEIIEELITAYPQAIFVKDRKGRTPLQCGIQLTQPKLSSSVSVSSAPEQSKAFKSIVTVLDLYCQIVLSGERQKAQLDARKSVEARMTQIQDSHLQTLTSLKHEWKLRQEESEREIQKLKAENRDLLEKIGDQDMTIQNLEGTEVDLQRKVEDMSIRIHEQVEANDSLPHDNSDQQQKDSMHVLVQELLADQREYHSKLNSVVENYEKLAQERKQIIQLLGAQPDSHACEHTKRAIDLRSWLEEKKSQLERANLEPSTSGEGDEDEKKDDSS